MKLPDAPLYSTITLCTEIIITSLILYIFYSGYKKNKFPVKTTFFALIYETLFNVSYMATRATQHKQVLNKLDPYIWLGALHGITSLIMFILLIAFMITAWRKYKKGVNYFKEHRVITFTFIFFWLLAIISGISFYVLEYFV